MTGTVLLVEDDPNDEAFTLRALKKCELAPEVVVARDGQEALDYVFSSGPYAGRSPPRPQLVLLDLKLPKVDGIEVLRRLRAEELTRRVPVVMLTSSSEERDLLDCYRLGANSYIQKPVEARAFSDAVTQVGLYWLALNRPSP